MQLNTKRQTQQCKRQRWNSYWWMQDGAMSHTMLKVHQFLGRVISCRSVVIWTQHSSDLNLLNYFFWTYTRMQVQQGKLATIIELKEPSRTFQAQFRRRWSEG